MTWLHVAEKHQSYGKQFFPLMTHSPDRKYKENNRNSLELDPLYDMEVTVPVAVIYLFSKFLRRMKLFSYFLVSLELRP
jgi:hypothetical protein